MQVGIITRHTNLLSTKCACVLNLGHIPAEAGLALCCEPCRVGGDLPVGLLLVRHL